MWRVPIKILEGASLLWDCLAKEPAPGRNSQLTSTHRCGCWRKYALLSPQRLAYFTVFMIATLAGALSDTGPSFECQIFRTVSWTRRFHDRVILSNNMRWQGYGKEPMERKKCNATLLIGSDSWVPIFRALLHLLKGEGLCPRFLRLVPNSSRGFPKVNLLNQASDFASWLLLPGNNSPTTQGALASNVTQRFTASDGSGSTLKSNQSTQSEIDIFAIILSRSRGRNRGPWKRSWNMTRGHF